MGLPALLVAVMKPEGTAAWRCQSKDGELQVAQPLLPGQAVMVWRWLQWRGCI